MIPTVSKQRRTYNSLLFEKLLNLSEGTSPFTLVLDTVEQRAGPVVREFGRRAKIANSNILFVSYTTLRRRVPFEISVFVTAHGKPLSVLQDEILSHLPTAADRKCHSKYLVVIDSLGPLASSHPEHMTRFLASLQISPAVALLASYHVDVPRSLAKSSYLPEPLLLLTYLATTILTVSSFSQVLSRKQARDRSLPEPMFGLDERKEGLLIGRRQKGHEKELVVSMELRRRSGTGVLEYFVLVAPSSPSLVPKFMLLDDHPVYTAVPSLSNTEATEPEGKFFTTFELELTEKQKKDREAVILPYFDAQRNGGSDGPGEGGQILYQIGTEDHDDFDEEEDEI
ncbi:hypothetical protein K3495_g911 [Podosphaera aphanis]|nr:hypothetical protein K3495_g911 [Podosphaera aphanis]